MGPEGAFGGFRTTPNSPITSTDFGYTGQRNLDTSIGLMDYKARFYSPVLGRFIQPDTLIPDSANPQTWNRFSYVANRPINFNDPTGHRACQTPEECNDMGTTPNGNGSLGNNSTSSENNDEIDDALNSLTDIWDANASELLPIPFCGKDATCYFLVRGNGPAADGWQEVPCEQAYRYPKFALWYEGPQEPVFALFIDMGGMTIDGLTIASAIFPPALIKMGSAEVFYSFVVELPWKFYMSKEGKYDIYDEHLTNMLDSQAAMQADQAEIVPVAGFSASFVSAINNLQVISEGFTTYPTFVTTWNGSPPSAP